MNRIAVCVIACLAVASVASAQPIPPMMPVQPGLPGIPPATPTVALPPSVNPVARTTPSSLPPVVPVAPGAASSMNDPASTPALNGVPLSGGGMSFLPGAPINQGGLFPVQAQPMPTPPAGNRGQTPAQDPLLSSRPPPFQVAPDAAAAASGERFFDGFSQVHNAFDDVLSGRFRETKYKWYGFVRLDGIFDYKPMGTTDAFVTSSIPVPQGRGQNSVLTPRYTRLGFDTETPLKDLDWTMKTRIEMDFFNGFSSGSFGTFPLRLRFAWADFGPFLIGQAASLFMDYDVFPNVLDYEGPGGMILMRQPIISVHFPVGEKVKVSVGIEQPYSDIQWFENGGWVVNPGNGNITKPGVGRNIQDVPDLTGNVRYAGDYGHMQVAGIVRKLTFQPGTGDAFSDVGYGINATGTLHPWALFSGTPKSGDCATIWSRSRFMGQFAAGRGISRYIQDVGGLGLDATYDPISGFRAVPSYGWFAAYEQWWAKKWASVFTYGEDSFDLPDTMPGNTYQKANYISANIIWLPVDRMGVGLEILHGFRQNKDGQRGDNTRIQLGVQYRF